MSDLTDRLRRIRLVRREIHVGEVAAAYEAADMLDAIDALERRTVGASTSRDSMWIDGYNAALDDLHRILHPEEGT